MLIVTIGVDTMINLPHGAIGIHIAVLTNHMTIVIFLLLTEYLCRTFTSRVAEFVLWSVMGNTCGYANQQDDLYVTRSDEYEFD